MRCLVEDVATFAVTAGAWLRREPALHNVLLTRVADRLSGDVPLSGGIPSIMELWWRIDPTKHDRPGTTSP